MQKSLEYRKNEVLSSLNGQTISIPTNERVEEVAKSVNSDISYERTENTDPIGVAVFKIVLELKLGIGRIIEEVNFRGVLNRDGIEWKGDIEEEFDVPFDEIYQGRSLKIQIPEKEIENPYDNKFIKLPEAFRGEIIMTSIGIMGILNIGGKKINITDYNY